MKIYSWNVKSDNGKQKAVLDFISRTKFDVFCLQEVSRTLLEEIRSLKYNARQGVDFERIKQDGNEKFYSVILTPHKILRTEIFKSSSQTRQPKRTRFFIGLMKIFGWTKISEHKAIYVDVKINGKEFRVFSIHLSLKGPLERIKEFNTLARKLKRNGQNIICGDFNVIEQKFLKPASFLMGSSFSEAKPSYPERERFEEAFAKANLKNPLKGRRTHTLFKAQLDHILIPKDKKTNKARVIPSSLGSDHYPIFVNLDTKHNNL